MIVFLAVAALLVAAIALFMNRPEFGRAPRGERLERIWRSPNYRDGAFRNRHATPQLTSGKGWWATMYDFLFERKERNRPDHALPAVKTDLKALDPKENLLVWFGHSSYLIQADGLRILVDPVFETASPLPFFNRPFEGTDLYKPEDMPGIDLLVITHDHWDHLDYGTVTKLRDRTGRVVCPLGVGEYFEYWGFDPQRITELDWGEQAALGGGFTVYCRPARHFSGRTFRANRTLWASFVVETPSQRIFLGGDGGYDTHFADVAREFPNLDVAVLEDGQYSEDWRYIHMLPADLKRAVEDLGARRVFPVHNSKYALARHPWDEPLNKMRLHSRRRIPRRGSCCRESASRYVWTGPTRCRAGGGQLPKIERERRSAFALFFYLSPVFPALFFALIGYGFHQLADLFGIAQKVIFHQT